MVYLTRKAGPSRTISLVAVGSILSGARLAFGQAVAEPEVDRAGSRAGQGLRHTESFDDYLHGDHATGDWFGLRPKLVERGVTFEASLIADFSKNLRGGLGTAGEAFRHLFDASLTFESEPLLGYKGGKLFVDFQTQAGDNGTELLLGDFQGFSNIDADGLTALYELWYEQILFDGRLRFKLGKLDAAGDFAFVDNGVEFINSSAGADPALLGYPTYPDPATGVLVFVYPVEGLYFGVGAYDGATQDGRPTGMRGPSTFFGKPSDLYLMGEAGLGWEDARGRVGRLGIGVSHHTGTFDVLNGTGRTEDGATAAYLVLDQTLWRENPKDENDNQGFAGFVQFALGEEDVAEADMHAALGATWRGAIPGRDDDILGVMASYVHFSNAAQSAGTFSEDYELAVEAFYKVALTPWVSIKPDLQYIVNPGGNGAEDALVITVRFDATF